MKYSKIIGAVLLGALATILIGSAAYAAGTFKAGDSTNLAKGEKVDSSLYIAGNNVTVAGIVDGDVFCAGQNVSITGTVHGDVICAGQNVRVDGNISGDVRLAGQTVNLGGKVRNNATVAAQTFTADAKSTVGGDATIMGQEATLTGVIGRDLVANGQNITINGQVGRDINGDMEQLTLSEGANIAGNIAYTSQNKVQQTKGSNVGGTVQRFEPTHGDNDGWRSVRAPLAGVWLYMLISLLIVALAVVLIFPRQVHDSAEYVLKRPGRTFLVGLIASFVVPIIFIALLVTVIGIPLAILMILVWFVLLFLSGPILGYVIGRLLLRDSKNSVAIMLLGSFIIIALYYVPIVGFFVMLAAVWFGTGGLLSAIHGSGHLQKKKLAKKKA